MYAECAAETARATMWFYHKAGIQGDRSRVPIYRARGRLVKLKTPFVSKTSDK